MKKHSFPRRLLSVLVLVMVMSLAFATPTFAAKPTTKNVKAKITKVSYNNSSMKCYFTIKFSNNSSKKIKSVKVTMSGDCGETVSATKTVKLNLKAKKSKSVKVCLGETIDKPESCKVKIKSIKY